MSVGMTFVIITAGIDLSVGSLTALLGAIALTALNNSSQGGQPENVAVFVAVAAALGSGTLLGLLNGVIIAYGRVVPFVTTLIGLLAFRSLAQALAEGGEIRSASSNIYPNFGSTGIPIPFIQTASGPLIIMWPIIAWIALSLLGSLLLNKTTFGRYVIAVGANERAARYSGISVSKVKLLTYTFSGFCVGVAALGITSRLNSVATSSVGLYYELDAIAAVVIGGTSLRGGYGRLWGTFMGVLLLGLINNMLHLSNVSPYLQGVVKGLVILVAVLLQRTRSED